MDKNTKNILEAHTKKAESRLSERAELEQELQSDNTVEAAQSVTKKSTKGLSSQKIKKSVEDEITQLELSGLFDAFPIQDRSKYSSILFRIPIFPLLREDAQKKRLNKDNGFEFESPYGTGIRFGPNLTWFDERVLIALHQLRQKRLSGESGRLPHPVSKIFKSNDYGKVDVDMVICLVTEILDKLSLSKGKNNYERVKKSIKKLTNCRIQMHVNNEDRYLGKIERGTSFELINVQWQTFEEEGIFYIQFSPIVTYWIEKEYTRYDFDFSKKLGTNGTAIRLHQFLSSQFSKNVTVFERTLDHYARTIGLYDEPKRNREKLKQACQLLKDLGWLTHYEFKGTGRKTPVTLEVIRYKVLENTEA